MKWGLLRLRRLALRKSITEIAIECDLPVQVITDLENGILCILKDDLDKVLDSYQITEEELKEGIKF